MKILQYIPFLFVQLMKNQDVGRCYPITNFPTYKYLFLIVFVFPLTFSVLKAQPKTENKNKPFKYIRFIKNKYDAPLKIEFWDSLRNVKITELDLNKAHPFNNLSKNVAGYNKTDSLPIFEMAAEMVNNSRLKVWSDKYNLRNLDDKDSVKIILKRRNSYNSQKYIAVIYLAQIYSGRKIISTRNYIFTYNRNGSLIFNSENLDLDPYEPQISDDGRYLCCLTGADYGEGTVSNVPPGLIIFDLNNGKVIHFEQGDNFRGPMFIGGHYFSVLKLYNGEDEYEIMNCDDKVTHSLRLSIEKTPELMEQSCTGFKFKDIQTGKVYYKLYNPDFITKKMQIDEK